MAARRQAKGWPELGPLAVSLVLGMGLSAPAAGLFGDPGESPAQEQPIAEDGDGEERPAARTPREASGPGTVNGVTAYRLLVDLREPELSARAAALLETSPAATRDALLLRAGADAPPGSTTAQRAQHAALAGEALGFVRQSIDASSDASDAWSAHLRGSLTRPGTEDLLWHASARAAAELRLYELAPEIAGGLASGRPIRETGARAALHRLFVRWFTTREEFEAYWAPERFVRTQHAFHTDLVERDRLARDRLAELMDLDAPRALAHLSESDPRVRAAAARSMARAVAARRAEAKPTLDALLQRLEREREAHAFHAELEAVLELLAGSQGETPELLRLRSALTTRIDERHLHLAPSIAYGLSRMYWSIEPAGSDDPAGVGRALDCASRLVVELARPDRVVQPEALISVLQGARALIVRCQEGGLALDAQADPVRQVVLTLVADPGEVRSVRLVASQLLARIAAPLDIERLVRLLEDEESVSTDLRFSVLGTLASLARTVGPDDARGARVLECLERHVDSPSADLRGRALALLLEEGLEPLAARADLDRMVRRLGEETSGEIAVQLLAFLARHGGAEQLDACLESPAVDLLVVDSARRARLVEMLAHLAGDDPGRVLRVARRLLDAQDEASRIRRLQQALELVARLGEQDARSLPREQHDEVLAWALELRAATGAPLATASGGERLRQRVAGVHLAQASPPPPEDGRAEHLRALLLADLFGTPQAEPAERELVLTALERAVRLAEVGKGSRLEVVLRDRARFLNASGDLAGARADYERVLALHRASVAAGAAAEAQPAQVELERAVARALDRGDLHPVDLRRAAELRREPPGAGDRGSACDLLLALIAHSDWRDEAASARVADLETLAELSLAAGDAERTERVRSLLTGLPALPEPSSGGVPTTTPALSAVEEGPAWNGLLGERAWHTRLLATCARLGISPTQPSPPGPDPAPEHQAEESTPAQGSGTTQGESSPRALNPGRD